MGAFLDFRLKWQYQGKSGEIKAGQESLFHRAFLNLRHELVDWSPAFQTIAEDVLEPFVAGVFKSEQAGGGTPWADLAASTVERRGSAHPILEMSGILRRSFAKGAPEHHEEITAKKLVWGSDVPHALFHQTGTGKGFQRSSGVTTGPGSGRGMAMRKILEFTDALKHRMDRTMTGRIAQVARQLGFKIASRPGETISPAEAARIGRIALGLRP